MNLAPTDNEQPSLFQQFRERLADRLEPAMRQIVAGIDSLGDTVAGVGVVAARGVGTIASLIGLAAIIPTSSRNNMDESQNTPIVLTNHTVVPAEPAVSQERAVAIAMDRTINSMSDDLRSLMDNYRAKMPTLAFTDLGSTINNQSPTQTPAAIINRGQGVATYTA